MKITKNINNVIIKRPKKYQIKFNKIYKKIYKSKDLDIYSNEIIDIIKKNLTKLKKVKKNKN